MENQGLFERFGTSVSPGGIGCASGPYLNRNRHETFDLDSEKEPWGGCCLWTVSGRYLFLELALRVSRGSSWIGRPKLMTKVVSRQLSKPSATLYGKDV